MPTERHGKVRRLLKSGKAKVIRRTPFTIQLLYDSEPYVQPVVLGVDAGSKVVGLSATTEQKELYAAECELRTDVVSNISTGRECRRTRRSRKIRYRKPRFLNRVRSRKKGWLAPSVIQKINTHIQLINQIFGILPVSRVIIEVASFDIQKIKNPNIQGSEYQEGVQLGFWNVREYVLWRDNHQCQHCKGRSGDKILNVHHLDSRKTGGNAPNNLITLCETCHDGHHLGEITVTAKRGQSFKDSAFMGIMRWALYERLKRLYTNVGITYGYITKSSRIANGLPKSHVTDARCITGNPIVKPIDRVFRQKAVRTKNRQIHKIKINKGSKRKLNQSPKYVMGYQLFDKVLYKNQELFVWGRRMRGTFLIKSLDGKIKYDGVSHNKLKLIQRSKSILIA